MEIKIGFKFIKEIEDLYLSDLISYGQMDT